MAAYSVAAAKAGLSSLLDKALAGEEVVITRHGKPVAELKASAPPAEAAKEPVWGSTEWLIARRAKLPKLDITSVELLNQIYEDDPL